MHIIEKFTRRMTGLALFVGLVFSGIEDANAQSPITLAGPRPLAEILIPATLEAYARDVGLTLRREISGDDVFSLILSDPNAQGSVARIDVRVTGSSQSLAALADGAADIAVTMRAAGGDEIAALVSARQVAIGRDAMVAVVARDNPATQISIADLASVLTGKTTSWQELGGPDAPIHVHLREPGSEQDAMLREQFLGAAGPGGTIKLHLSDASISDAVAQDPLALGITSFSDVGNAKSLNLSGACGFSVAPTRFGIKNSDFPLTLPLMVYHRPARLPQVLKDYLRYLESSSAQGAIRQAGYIDQFPEVLPLMSQGSRLMKAISIIGQQSPASELRRLVANFSEQGRLSVTFRFQPKSSELDRASRESVTQLAQALLSGQFDGRSLTFIGFSDGVGTSEQNLRVGRSRVRVVEAAVREAAQGLREDRISLGSDAFGEALPIACDDTDWGRQVNRRVEVWID